MHKMYSVYLGKIMCPIAPNKIELKINNQNQTVNLINDGEINMLKKAGLTDISFNLLLPNVKYPFAVYKDGYRNAKYFLDEIERLKGEKKPFQFIVVRSLPNGKMLFNTNMKVSLEEYSLSDNVSEGFDITVTMRLKQYKDYGLKKCEVEIKEKEIEVESKLYRETGNSPAPVSQNKSYTVVKGDCLWNIAKKFYGNGGQYMKIAAANSIPNPNLIYPGQVLTVPV